MNEDVNLAYWLMLVLFIVSCLNFRINNHRHSKKMMEKPVIIMMALYNPPLDSTKVFSSTSSMLVNCILKKASKLLVKCIIMHSDRFLVL